MGYNVGTAGSYLKPSGLLINTVFYKFVLSEIVRVALDKIQFGIIETPGSLKLCERGSDHLCRSGGGKSGPRDAEARKPSEHRRSYGMGESRDLRC